MPTSMFCETGPDINNRESELNDLLERRLQTALEDEGYAQLRSIDCTVEPSAVVLEGELNSFYLKQLAQTVATKVVDSRDVINNIVVAYD